MRTNILISHKRLNRNLANKKLSARILRAWQLYLLLLVPLIYIGIFNYVPMAGIQLAFKEFSPNLGIWSSPWVGFKHFTKFFGSYQFRRVLTNTITISLYSIVAGFPVPIILALCLNCVRSEKYKKFIQTVTYIPHFISVVVLVGIVIQVFNPIVGIYGNIVQWITGERAVDLLGIPSAFPHFYVWSGVWQNMGWSSIIYMAALSNIDTELHEAAEMDGASRFKRIIHIDLPGIIPTAITLLILRTGSIMNIGFEKVFLMQNPLNLQYSEVISTYVYKIGLGSGGRNDFSYSTAIGLFNSIINLALIVIVNEISKKLGETSLW